MVRHAIAATVRLDIGVEPASVEVGSAGARLERGQFGALVEDM
jgi:hypothetical protein